MSKKVEKAVVKTRPHSVLFFLPHLDINGLAPRTHEPAYGRSEWPRSLSVRSFKQNCLSLCMSHIFFISFCFPTNNPQNRPNPTPKGDVDSTWSHDLFDQHNSLVTRLNATPGAPKANLNAIARKALHAATSSSEQLSIKGASSASQGNVVEVTGLVAGTTPDDVVAIFKRCGEIVKAASMSNRPEVTIRVTFKAPAAASAAVQKFDGQPADGKTLSVQIVGTKATSLGGRLGGPDGLGLVREEGSVDILMDTPMEGGSSVLFSSTASPK